jgi:hypothetical protein
VEFIWDDSHWLYELAEAMQLTDGGSFGVCTCQGPEEKATEWLKEALSMMPHT